MSAEALIRCSRYHVIGLLTSLLLPGVVVGASGQLVVVEDLGGRSAFPYYEALNLLPPHNLSDNPDLIVPTIPLGPVSESDMLPVRSVLLTPGQVEPRIIAAPGLQPIFLVGDDTISHAWLDQYAAVLMERNAVGLAVNVETTDGLDALRRRVPGLLLSPVSADDLAQRLGLRHYPVLITSTGIEQ